MVRCVSHQIWRAWSHFCHGGYLQALEGCAIQYVWFKSTAHVGMIQELFRRIILFGEDRSSCSKAIWRATDALEAIATCRYFLLMQPKTDLSAIRSYENTNRLKGHLYSKSYKEIVPAVKAKGADKSSAPVTKVSPIWEARADMKKIDVTVSFKIRSKDLIWGVRIFICTLGFNNLSPLRNEQNLLSRAKECIGCDATQHLGCCASNPKSVRNIIDQSNDTDRKRIDYSKHSIEISEKMTTFERKVKIHTVTDD